MILRLAIGSLRARLLTVGLAALSIALSLALLVGIDQVRSAARSSFAATISNTDLIVGGRSNAVQLMLYTVFGIGSPTGNFTWESYEAIAERPETDWIVPLSLGDSHDAYRVLGTSPAFFDRYRYRGGQALTFTDGMAFSDLFDAVVGAEVAVGLGYGVGAPLVVSHGMASFTDHDDQPFRVSGILARTGTAVDRTVMVSLEALEAIHVDWQSGARIPGRSTPEEAIRAMDLTPSAITAALVGVESRIQIFQLQRWINEYSQEPLSAVLPGLALQELWQTVSLAETALFGVSLMIVATSLIGMVALIFSSLNERRREMAILRAMGARPLIIFVLLVVEAVMTALVGVVMGMVLLYGLITFLGPVFDAAFGIWLPLVLPSAQQMAYMLAITFAAGVAAGLPAIRAYRMSLVDGMTVRT